MLLTTKNVQVDTQAESERDIGKFYYKLSNDIQSATKVALGKYIPLASTAETDALVEGKDYSTAPGFTFTGGLAATIALVHSLTFEDSYAPFPVFSVVNYMSNASITGEISPEYLKFIQPSIPAINIARQMVEKSLGKGWYISVRILDSQWVLDKSNTEAKVRAMDRMVDSGLIELDRILNTGKTGHKCFDIKVRAMNSIATNIIKIVKNNSDSENYPTGEPVGIVIEATVKDPMFLSAREINTGLQRMPSTVMDISSAANKGGLPVVLMLGLTSPGEDTIVEAEFKYGIPYFKKAPGFIEDADKDDTSIAYTLNHMIDIPYKIIFPSNKDMSASFKTKYLRVQDEINIRSQPSQFGGLRNPFGGPMNPFARGGMV